MHLLVIPLLSILAFFVTFIGAALATGDSELAAWIAIAVGFVVAPLGLLRWWSPPADRGGVLPEASFVVEVTATAIRCTSPDGSVAQVSKAGLQSVLIATDANGPWSADLWWHLRGADGLVLFPGGATGEDAVLGWLETLPGYDGQAVVEAMGSTRIQHFLCWRAPD